MILWPDMYEIRFLTAHQINYMMHELHGLLQWEMFRQVSYFKKIQWEGKNLIIFLQSLSDFIHYQDQFIFN